MKTAAVTRHLALASFLGLAASAAMAQGGTPETTLNQNDRNFVRDAAIGGMAEVELGKLAQNKGQSDAVKAFGRRMVEDHGKANEQLAGIAKEAGATLPDALDDEHKAIRTELERASGAVFERSYIDAQVVDHQKSVTLFEWYVNAGQNAKLKSFAADSLPTLMQHLEAATDLQAATPAPQTMARAPAPAAATGSSAPTPSPPPAAPVERERTRDLNQQELKKIE
jgi:putative membrane protein